MKKGQMSLEMIIGLLILLVVAVVVIRIFLTNIQNVNKPGGDMQTKIDELGFVSQCENLCNDYLANPTRAALAKYCYTKLTKTNDLDKDGRVSHFTAPTRTLEICEDGVYCFHVKECKTDGGVIDWKDCREVVCEAYADVFGSMAAADRKVAELFNFGTCKGVPDNENWVKMYFNRGDNKPCTKPPGLCIVRLDECDFKVTGFTFECRGEFIKENCKDKEIFILAKATKGSDELVMYAAPGNTELSIPSGSSFTKGSVGSITVTENKITGTYHTCVYTSGVRTGCDKDIPECWVCSQTNSPTGYTCEGVEIMSLIQMESFKPSCNIIT